MSNTNKLKGQQYNWGFLRSGAISGFISTLIFTIIHHIFISDIWFSFPLMAAAGIISGISISGSYNSLFINPAARSWLTYNSIFIAMFFLLGLISVLYFEPVTTVSALIEATERPGELISAAFPMTIIFTISFSILISYVYARRPIQYAIILVTCSILMLILGLNVSIIGLISIPTSSFYLILELFGLIFIILAVYAILFLLLEKKNMK